MIDFDEKANELYRGLSWYMSYRDRIAAALREAYEAGRRDENEACAKEAEDAIMEVCTGKVTTTYETGKEIASAIRQRLPNAKGSEK